MPCTCSGRSFFRSLSANIFIGLVCLLRDCAFKVLKKHGRRSKAEECHKANYPAEEAGDLRSLDKTVEVMLS